MEVQKRMEKWSQDEQFLSYARKRMLEEINHVPVTSAHAAVYEGDVFTVRGMGRFKLEALGGKSRKDRLFIQYFQY